MSFNSYERSQHGPGLSTSFTPSSWSSSLGVAEAIASYRRSQYIITGQNVASSVGTSERDDLDEEVGRFTDEEEEEDEFRGTRVVVDDDGEEDEDEVSTPVLLGDDDALVGALGWEVEGHDDDSGGGEVTPRSVSRPIPGRPVPGRGRRTRNRRNRSRIELATEQSPLLRKEPSRSSIVRQYTQGPVDGLSVVDTQAGELDEGGDTQGQKTLQLRRKSSAISKVEKEFVPGRSTFGQTVSIFYTCTLL